jgi:hypothetical protein
VRGKAGAANSTRALRAGGYGNAYEVDIDYFTIASTGNATDFGDLSVGRMTSGASVSHGGIG